MSKSIALSAEMFATVGETVEGNANSATTSALAAGAGSEEMAAAGREAREASQLDREQQNSLFPIHA